MTVEIVFETHSLSTDNEAGIATGWRQGELSEEGRRLARRLGERRRGERIDAVYASDLRRAVETAELGSVTPGSQSAATPDCASAITTR